VSVNAPFWPRIESTDPAGITAVDMLGIVFFLDPGACADPSYAVGAFQKYLDGIGRHHPLAYVDDEGDMLAVPDNPGEVLARQIVRPMQAGESARMFLADATKKPYRYYAQYFYEPIVEEGRKPDERVPIFFRVSQEVFAGLGPESAISFALELSELLPYSYGYLSPVITCEESFRTALPYLRRYPGFDVADVESVAIDIGDRPSGVHWVNLFGRRLSQSLGGAEAVRSTLPPGARVQPCGQGGLCVILGDAPDVGDVNRQNDLPLYRQLAALARPYLRVPEVTYFTSDDGLLDRDAQVAWHERFLR
jgi:hypothetical protein